MEGEGLSGWWGAASCWVLKEQTLLCGVCCFGSRPMRSSNCSGVVGVVVPAAGVGGGGVCGVWLLFENCTVDASIFVVKLLRAVGGCLGTRSR